MIVFVLLGGSIFLMGCFILGITVFRLTQATLCIGEVCDINATIQNQVSVVTFCVITEYEGKKIELEPLTTLTLCPIFFEKSQLKRIKRKYLEKKMKIYVHPKGSYLKRFLPRYFLMGIFLLILGGICFFVPFY